jgi:phosphomethylpyrimidine synthase
MTLLQDARAGRLGEPIVRAAEGEPLSPEQLRDEIAAGRAVIPANRLHLDPPDEGSLALQPIAIGRSVTTKINANIGTSTLSSCAEQELVKLRLAVESGAHAVMDLSTGGDLDEIRRRIIAASSVPIGTVPIYSMIVDKSVEELTGDDILEMIARQAAQGVDFFTIHAGLLRRHLPAAHARKLGIVSRGGSLIAKWMTHHERENPFYELFDEITAILAEYDVAYSLGDGLRPGCLADASDEAQFGELEVLGELVQRSREAGVQVMVEGPGHVPLDQVPMNMRRQQEVCDGAPFYVLGPVVTDVFPGYDHIAAAIGATLAAQHGASFLCYVTPAEHLSLPRPEDVAEGCAAFRLAAHAGDVARGLCGARDWDDRMADARAAFDWPGQFRIAFDPARAEALRSRDHAAEPDADYCSMCGKDWCAMRISKELREKHRPAVSGD